MPRAVFLLAIVMSVVVAGVVAGRAVTRTDARTTDATMALSVSTGGACSDSTCTVAAGTPFVLTVDVVTAPAEGYIGIATEIDYAAFVANGGLYVPRVVAGEIVWPDSAMPLRSPAIPTGTEGVVNHSDATAVVPPGPTSAHEGTVVELDLLCSDVDSSSVIDLVQLDAGNTNGSGFKAPGGADIPAKTASLTIDCAVPDTPPPSATATATVPAPTSTSPPPATPTPEILYGDADCNGVVDPADAALMLQLNVGFIASVPCPEEADVNHDQRISALDALLTLQRSAAGGS